MEQRPKGPGQPNPSGLQVVPAEGDRFPEVSGPLSWKQEGVYAYALTPGPKAGEHGAPEVAVSSMPEPIAPAAAAAAPTQGPPPLHRPQLWWRRKRWILAIA